MKEKLTFFLCFLGLLVIAVCYSMWPESEAKHRSIDSDAATGKASRRNADIVATNKTVRRSLRLQDLKRWIRAARNSPDLPSDVLNSPSLHSLPDETDTPEMQAANRAEDAILAAEANAPEKIQVLRKTAMSENPDEEWTERMTDEIYEKVDSVLKNDVDISNISCHETVCLAYIEFIDEDDAATFALAGQHDLQYEYEYQHMMPFIELSDDSPQHKENYYEVLIKKRGAVAVSTEPPLP